MKGMNVVKSPSDSTLYTPALQKVPNQAIVDGISNFIKTIRMETSAVEKEGEASTSTGVRQPRLVTSKFGKVPEKQPLNTSLDEARDRAQQSIIEVEKFKASIAPAGLNSFDSLNIVENVNAKEMPPNSMQMQWPTGVVENQRNFSMGEGLSDDDFFHLTCHIDDSLKLKIEKGEFVDLEKLLPRDKVSKRLSDDTRLEWVNHDSGTYLVPATDNDRRISSIRKWDQAFRVYATIYLWCKSDQIQRNLAICVRY